MRITLLANAGLYIEIEDKRFLLDAIHYDEDYVFSRLPKNLCWDMLHGVGKYANVEKMLRLVMPNPNINHTILFPDRAFIIY